MTDVRSRLLRAAAEVYAETGFRGTTTRRVADRAGVNEITLFRHFGSKESLIRAALESLPAAPARVQLAEPRDPPSELRAWAWSLYQRWFETRRVLRRVLGDLSEHPELAPGLREDPEREHAMLTAYLDRMKAMGLAAADFRPETAAGLLIGPVLADAVLGSDGRLSPTPPEETVRQYVALLLAGIGAETGQPRAR